MIAEIRRATPDDVQAVLDLWLEAEAEPSHTDTVTGVHGLITHDPAALLVAVDAEDNRIVGSIIAGWDGWRGSIYRLAVVPRYRRAGLGRRLLAAAEARLRDSGAVRSQAVVVESDQRATGFWRSSGWEQQAERLRFVSG